jgi:methionyl-tRNA formyltransferase
MKIAIIGRSDALFRSAVYLQDLGHEIGLVWTSRAAPEYENNELKFKEFANDLNVPYLYGSQIKIDNTYFEELNLDIAVSSNFTRIIEEPIIKSFPLGILNAHGGDLPKYRGNACQAWAILNGESKIGLCIHKMLGGQLDIGDILARDYFKINEKTKITDVIEWINLQTPFLFANALDSLKKNPDYVLVNNTHSKEVGSRCYPRRPEDGKIDWKSSAIQILRLINASNKPYQGAFCYLENKKVTIWDAEIYEDKEIIYAVPGQITEIDNDDLVVACGYGKLRIKKLDIDGIEMTSSHIISSIRQRLT